MCARVVTFILFAALPLCAAAVRLPCVADVSDNPDPHAQELVLRPAALLNFRFDSIRRWHVDKASLFLHLSSGEAPEQLDIAPVPERWSERNRAARRRYAFLTHSVHTESGGWLSVPLRQPILEELIRGKAWGLAVSSSTDTAMHSRESEHTPYLLIDGHSTGAAHAEPQRSASRPQP